MVEVEVQGQMITHVFLDPDRMSSSYPKHSYTFERFGDVMQWVLCCYIFLSLFPFMFPCFCEIKLF